MVHARVAADKVLGVLHGDRLTGVPTRNPDSKEQLRTEI